MHVYGKKTPPIHSEKIHFGKCTQFKSNCMHVRVHTLSTISTQESSQTNNGPIKISKSIYSLDSRANLDATDRPFNLEEGEAMGFFGEKNRSLTCQKNIFCKYKNVHYV